MLKRTPFYDFHVSAGARMVDFAGWEMPIVYRSIIAEHEQTRNSAAIFDVSHMGRLHFTGKGATAFLNRALTRNVSEQKVGQSRYSLVCNDAGGVLDDIIISRDEPHWLMVCNASNREKLVAHFRALAAKENHAVEMVDQTESTAMVALQGPKVIDRLSEALPIDIRSMKRYSFVTEDVMFVKLSVFRSGYTGEDGVEIILSAKAAAMAIKLLSADLDRPSATLQPAGLGAGHATARGGHAAVRPRARRDDRSPRRRPRVGG